MRTQQEIDRLSREAEDLSEFLSEACKLRGKAVTRASKEAGLSRNTISSFILKKRRPSPRSAYKLARYFGVPAVRLLRLVGFEMGAPDPKELEALSEEVRTIASALDAEELNEWLQFGEMLLLRRERRIMEESRGDVEGESD